MKQVLPPTYLLASLLVMGGLWKFLPGPRVVAPRWNLAGIALIILGAALNIIGDGQFKRAKTAINPFGRPSTLVTSGVFGYSRNPMYLGMLFLVLGLAILVGRATLFMVPLLLLVILKFRFVALEEQAMTARFGDDYSGYRTRVRRWL